MPDRQPGHLTRRLADGSPDDVEREVLECLRDAAPGGGYILAPDHSFHGGIPYSNIQPHAKDVQALWRLPLDIRGIEAQLADLGFTG